MGGMVKVSASGRSSATQPSLTLFHFKFSPTTCVRCPLPSTSSSGMPSPLYPVPEDAEPLPETPASSPDKAMGCLNVKP